MRILVVDDEKIIRDLAKRMLERKGHVVMTVCSGEEALGELKSQNESIDVALLDWNLERMTGAETLREIRHLIPDCPAIFSSGEQLMDHDIPEDLAVNTHLLMKPYRSADLIEMIEQAIPRAEAE